MWFRSPILRKKTFSVFGPRRIRRVRRVWQRDRRTRGENGARTIRRSSPIIARRCAPPPIIRVGVSPSIALIADRPNCCSRSTRAWAPALILFSMTVRPSKTIWVRSCSRSEVPALAVENTFRNFRSKRHESHNYEYALVSEVRGRVAATMTKLRKQDTRMIGGFPLAFAQPWLLAALIALPALWWLLRVMPPRPKRVEFPPTRLLLQIAPKEETPARTPWWLTALRLLAVALVIIAAAGPIWNPATGLGTLQRSSGAHDRRRVECCCQLGRAHPHRRRTDRQRRKRSTRRRAGTDVGHRARHHLDARRKRTRCRSPAVAQASRRRADRKRCLRSHAFLLRPVRPISSGFRTESIPGGVRSLSMLLPKRRPIEV